MSPSQFLPCVALFAFLIVPAGCESAPPARIKSDDEADLVDERGIGAAGFEKLIVQSVQKLLDKHRGDASGLPMRRVAFVNLMNRTKEELGEWREQIIDKIQVGVSTHPAFNIVSEQMVNAVLREMGTPPVEQLFLPKYQRQFAKILEQKESPVQFLLYGSLTRGGTTSGDLRQANYMLKLELADVATGMTDQVAQEIRKEYRQ